MLNDSLIIEKNFIKINKEFGLMRNRSIDDEIKKKVYLLIKNILLKKMERRRYINRLARGMRQ